MQTITFEPLRWQDDAARVTIRNQNAHPDALFQVTAPRDVRSMAIGRPVEELPRILAILGPAHHIAGAKALDRLFDIQVPEPAQNMRNALLATYVFVEHLKKFSFLLLSECNPFAELRLVRKSERQSLALLEDIQHTIALGQEAGRILGGRSDHPITAIAGGISRFLKKEAYERLSEIASGCLAAAKRIAAVLHETALHPGGPLRTVDEVFIDRMPYLTVSAASPDSQEITVQLKEDGDNTLASYKEKELGDAIGIQKEPWTNAPFAFVHANGWPGLDTDSTAGLFFVGPLARLNSGQTLPTPLAEKERVRMIEKLGPPPHVSVKAAYHALLVEILQTAEQMTEWFDQKKFVGPAVRAIPTELGEEGCAALEAPQGMIYHRYRADSSGIATDVDVLDSAMQNNALYCLMTRKAVAVCRRQNKSWKETRAAVELSLLPF